MVRSLYAALSFGLTFFASHASAGILSSPSSGLVVAAGASFPFAYQDSNWCEDGYSQITVWLTGYSPTTSSLNSTGEFDEGEFTYYFGSYLIPNFGLSVLPGSIPPPSSLVFPTIPAIVTGDEVYLTVVETGDNCPPGLNVPPEYEVTGSLIVVG